MGNEERNVDEVDAYVMRESLSSAADALFGVVDEHVKLCCECVDHTHPETRGNRQFWEGVYRNQRRSRESSAALAERVALARMMPVVSGQFSGNVAFLASQKTDLRFHTEQERTPGRCILVTSYPMEGDIPVVNQDGSVGRYEGAVAAYEIDVSPFMVIDPRKREPKAGIASSIEEIKMIPTRAMSDRRALATAKNVYGYILKSTAGEGAVALATFDNLYQLPEGVLADLLLSKYERRFARDNAGFIPEAAGQAFEDVMGRLSGWKNLRRAGLYIATVPLGQYERAQYFPIDDAPEQYRRCAMGMLHGSD